MKTVTASHTMEITDNKSDSLLIIQQYLTDINSIYFINRTNSNSEEC